MSSATMTLSKAVPVSGGATAMASSSTRKTCGVVKFICSMNNHKGLKSQQNHHINSIGLPVCDQQAYHSIARSIYATEGRRGGGAFSTTCKAHAEEIFKIAAIMNVLTLIGVAVGFVLLRVEATLEEE